MPGLFGPPMLDWLLAGLALLLLELLLPGVYLFWFGLAALATGLAACLMGLFVPALNSWDSQIFIFIILSIAAVMLARRCFKHNKQSAAPFLNQTVEALIGRTVILAEPIENRQGIININDNLWRISGDNMPKGQKIRLTAYKNGVFEVEKADSDSA